MSDSYFKSGVFQTELPMFFSPKTYCSFNLSILINNYFILLVAEVKNLCFFSFSYNLYPIYQEILLAVPSHITTIQSIYIVFPFISCMYLLKCHFLSGSQDRYLGLSHPPATICIPFPVLCFFFQPSCLTQCIFCLCIFYIFHESKDFCFVYCYILNA